MKYIGLDQPYQVGIKEMERPIRKKGEALLKLLYGGICGSDLNTYRGKLPYAKYPLIPGHEFSAEIVEIDENENGLGAGMIVTANPYFNCKECYSCQRGFVNCCTGNQTMGVQRDGGFREYLTMPIERVYSGQGLSAKETALVEPFCISYHGIKRAKVQKGERVLVVGAGTIGVFAAISAKLAGAQVYMCDIAESKLNYAKNFGIDGFIHNDNNVTFLDQVKTVTDGNLFDVTVEAVGLPSTFQNCVDAVAFHGRTIIIGVGKSNVDFNFTDIQKKEMNIMGSRNAVKTDFEEVIQILTEKRIKNIDKIVTGEFNYLDAAEAFKTLDENAADMLKIMLRFS